MIVPTARDKGVEQDLATVAKQTLRKYLFNSNDRTY